MLQCKKNVAVIFITKVENGVTLNEGYCIKCARILGIPQIDQVVKQMGISEEDLDMISDEMSSMFGQNDDSEGESDEVDSQTANLPADESVWRRISRSLPSSRRMPRPRRRSRKGKKSKHKFLDNYCMDSDKPGPEGKLTRSSAGTWRRNGSSRF